MLSTSGCMYFIVVAIRLVSHHCLDQSGVADLIHHNRTEGVFLRAIDDVVPASRQIHMIVDNYCTHKHEK